MTEQPHPHTDRKQRQEAHYPTSLAQIAHTLRWQTTVQLRGGSYISKKHTGVVLHPSISVTWAPKTHAFGSPSHATAAQCAGEGGSRRDDGQILLKWTTPQGLCAFKSCVLPPCTAPSEPGALHVNWAKNYGGENRHVLPKRRGKRTILEHTVMARRRRRRGEL